MDGTGDLLKRIAAALAAYDDDALAALANKGLVRRAAKDLAKSPPQVLGADGDILQLKVEDQEVRLCTAIQAARCSCPADGVCRHILTACMFVRGQAQPTATMSHPVAPLAQPAAVAPADSAIADPATDAASPVPTAVTTPTALAELLALTDDAIESWAGRPLLRKGRQLLARDIGLVLEIGPVLVLRLPDLNLTCRWIPGAGLAGMLCSCHAPQRCEHRVAAVLACRLQQSGESPATGGASLPEPAGAARTRAEVRASVQAVLNEMVGIGLSRLSKSVEQRLRTLAVSAHAVDLPRLERLLRAIGDEIRLALARDAQAVTPRLLTAAARATALCQALEDPRPGFVGQHRSTYDRIGELDLVGMGARRWRTRSGYCGLTVYFWNRTTTGWVTWSEARPLSVAGFEPLARYTASGPWTGCESPRQISRQELRLAHVWRNRTGRLSGREATRIVSQRPAAPLSLPALVTQWPQLTDRAFRLFVRGLNEPNEQDEIVSLQVAAWGPPHFDPVTQELTRPIRDTDGRWLPLVLPYTAETEKAIAFLEAAGGADWQGVLGLLRLHHGKLAVEPVTLFNAQKLHHLTLDVAGAGASSATANPSTADAGAQVEKTEEGEEAEEDGAPEVVEAGSPTGRFLAAVGAQLVAIAESGAAAYRGLHDLRALAQRAETTGMVLAARALHRVVSALESMRAGRNNDPQPVAHAVLQASYLIQLAAEIEAITAATDQLQT